MGYVSEVALALTRQGAETMRRKLASPEISQKAKESIQDFLDHADKCAKDKESGHEAWSWEYLKWYRDEPEYYPEVDFIDKLMAELEEEDFRFIRIGEDYDDTEVRGLFCENPFDLELGRSISFSQAV